MCNIAGYAGNKQAAPILLEMLRKQELYDGGMSTGIATIYEGKLHYRSYVGTVEELIKNTDALDLPGTVGIAHTRPSGDKSLPAMHPNINPDKTMALVTNGTTPATKYSYLWSEAADLLDQNGYQFVHEGRQPSKVHPHLSRNGHHVSPAESRVHLIDYHIKQGKTITEAMALTCAALYSDNATVLVNENYPDHFFALRTTRPLFAIMENGETYMATAQFGLPDDLADRAFCLPLFHACKLSREGIEITSDKMDMEPVAELSPYTYAEAYKRFETLLKSGKALYFDELEFAADDMRDIFPGNHTCIQHARLVYELLWQFDKEGRLKREIRTQQRPHGTRERYYMWLEDESQNN